MGEYPMEEIVEQLIDGPTSALAYIAEPPTLTVAQALIQEVHSQYQELVNQFGRDVALSGIEYAQGRFLSITLSQKDLAASPIGLGLISDDQGVSREAEITIHEQQFPETSRHRVNVKFSDYPEKSNLPAYSPTFDLQNLLEFQPYLARLLQAES